MLLRNSEREGVSLDSHQLHRDIRAVEVEGVNSFLGADDYMLV